VSAYVVGLTGGIGSGKTTVSNLFATHGTVVVDTDVIAHQLTAPGGEAMPYIIAEFGPNVASSNGALDRAAMRQRVFADPAARQRLEAILHPMIGDQAMQACTSAHSAYVLLVVPLLVETRGWKKRCDRILLVDCDEATQIGRVMARSNLGETEARAILATQASRQERQAAADDIIDNDLGKLELAARVETLHRAYLGYAKSKNFKPSVEISRQIAQN